MSEAATERGLLRPKQKDVSERTRESEEEGESQRRERRRRRRSARA